MFSKKKNLSTFSDFIKGLQYSINSAQEIIESHNLYTLQKYFNEVGEPKIQRLNIDENRYLNVPIISVVNHNNISIDELEVEFETNIVRSEVDDFKTVKFDELNSEIERTKFYIDFGKINRKNKMKVKIKFKGDKNPEGMERIKTEFDKQIIPIEK